MSTFEQLVQYLRETALLESTSELLQWDERTYLPSLAGVYRAEQITLVSGMLHQRRTSPQLGEWLDDLQPDPSEPHSDFSATIRQARRDYDKHTKLPQDLVQELTRNSIQGQQSWVVARKERDFSKLQPYLERIIQLQREKAQAIGFEDDIYDPLLDDFEPGEKTADVARILSELREQLVPLVKRVIDSGRRPPVEIVSRSYPTDVQAKFVRLAAEQIGFDFERGRLDVTEHPFCTQLGPHDCRILTCYDERFLPSALYSTLHEAGHGMYEQGLRTAQFGLPPGLAASMGIHESQSRLWENLVGRSQAFWSYLLPIATKHFPAALEGVSVDQIVFAVNDVRASLIRIEADEATYNLHIIIRFELERELLDQSLSVSDLPTAWNERYKKYLGIVPPHDGDGVLQDIHWSAALFGYFPTYSLGNLYASQLFQQAKSDLGDLDSQFAAGQFGPLRQWLQEHVYTHGQCYSPSELIHKATGRPLSQGPLMDHLNRKYEMLYT